MRWWGSVALVVVVVALAAPAAAQEPPGYGPADGLSQPTPGMEGQEAQAVPPPPGYAGEPVEMPPQDAVRADDRVAEGGRIMLEALGGLVGYALGGAAGALAGCGIGYGLGSGVECAIMAVFFGVAGAGFGTAGGVDIAGDALDGEGGYWAAYLGQLVGGGVSLLFLFALEEDWGDEALLTAMVVLPVTGGIVGYEISHGRSASRPSLPLSASVVPVREGAVAVVAGEL